MKTRNPRLEPGHYAAQIDAVTTRNDGPTTLLGLTLKVLAMKDPDKMFLVDTVTVGSPNRHRDRLFAAVGVDCRFPVSAVNSAELVGRRVGIVVADSPWTPDPCSEVADYTRLAETPPARGEFDVPAPVPAELFYDRTWNMWAKGGEDTYLLVDQYGAEVPAEYRTLSWVDLVLRYGPIFPATARPEEDTGPVTVAEIARKMLAGEALTCRYRERCGRKAVEVVWTKMGVASAVCHEHAEGFPGVPLEELLEVLEQLTS